MVSGLGLGIYAAAAIKRRGFNDDSKSKTNSNRRRV